MDINWWWFNGNFIANLIGGIVSGIVGGITMGIILAFRERFTKYGKEQTVTIGAICGMAVMILSLIMLR